MTRSSTTPFRRAASSTPCARADPRSSSSTTSMRPRSSRPISSRSFPAKAASACSSPRALLRASSPRLAPLSPRLTSINSRKTTRSTSSASISPTPLSHPPRMKTLRAKSSARSVGSPSLSRPLGQNDPRIAEPRYAVRISGYLDNLRRDIARHGRRRHVPASRARRDYSTDARATRCSRVDPRSNVIQSCRHFSVPTI